MTFKWRCQPYLYKLEVHYLNPKWHCLCKIMQCFHGYRRRLNLHSVTVTFHLQRQRLQTKCSLLICQQDATERPTRCGLTCMKTLRSPPFLISVTFSVPNCCKGKMLLLQWGGNAQHVWIACESHRKIWHRYHSSPTGQCCFENWLLGNPLFSLLQPLCDSQKTIRGRVGHLVRENWGAGLNPFECRNKVEKDRIESRRLSWDTCKKPGGESREHNVFISWRERERGLGLGRERGN